MLIGWRGLPLTLSDRHFRLSFDCACPEVSSGLVTSGGSQGNLGDVNTSVGGSMLVAGSNSRALNHWWMFTLHSRGLSNGREASIVARSLFLLLPPTHLLILPLHPTASQVHYFVFHAWLYTSNVPTFPVGVYDFPTYFSCT